MQEFIEAGHVQTGCNFTLKANQLNRKVTSENSVHWVPTQCVVVTFAGQVINSSVKTTFIALTHIYLLDLFDSINVCY